MKPLLSILFFFSITPFVIAVDECPDTTNSIEYSFMVPIYVCNSEQPTLNDFTNLCDPCVGKCDNCLGEEICTNNKSAQITIPSYINGGEVDLGNCKNCKEGEKCWMVRIDAKKGGIICPCGCLTVSDNKNFTKSSIPDTCGDLVKLSNFTAKPTDKGISLNWNTETELDSQGFRIWRAIPDLSRYCGCSGNIDDYTKIQVLDEEGKPVLIPAKGSTTSGFDYAYLDEKAKPGIAYCYALEDVDSKGESKFYFEYVAFTPDGLSEETK